MSQADTHDLILRYLEGDLTPGEFAALNEQLRTDPAARDLYRTLLTRSADLRATLRSEPTAPSLHISRPKPDLSPRRSGSTLASKPLALAAALLLAAAAVTIYVVATKPQSAAHDPNPSAPIATLIESTGTLMVDDDIAIPGGDYGSGSYTIDTGAAEFMLTNHVTVNLRGSTRLLVHSPLLTTLDAGSARFHCPTGAEGFTVELPNGSRVVDLGTAFAVSLNDNGEAELRVNEGSVRLELDPNDRATHHVITAGSRAVVTLADRSMRLGRAGVAINVNFIRERPQTGLVGPAGGLDETWNQFTTFSATDLLDTDGLPTRVAFTSDGSGWGASGTRSDLPLAMIRDWQRTFATDPETARQELTITGLEPGDRYDVYIASALFIPQSQRSQGEWTMLNPSDSPEQQTVDNTARVNTDSWELGNNYVVFESVVVDDDGAIRLTGKLRRDSPYDTRLPLNGFQLRPAGDADDQAKPNAGGSNGELPPQKSR